MIDILLNMSSSTCFEFIKKYFNKNINTFLKKNDECEYHILKNKNDLNEKLIENTNDLNETIIDNNEQQPNPTPNPIFSLEDENMLKSIIKENNELLEICKNDNL
jgi:hypothetical protein